jgi:hypothetical protein
MALGVGGAAGVAAGNMSVEVKKNGGAKNAPERVPTFKVIAAPNNSEANNQNT